MKVKQHRNKSISLTLDVTECSMLFGLIRNGRPNSPKEIKIADTINVTNFAFEVMRAVQDNTYYKITEQFHTNSIIQPK